MMKFSIISALLIAIAVCGGNALAQSRQGFYVFGDSQNRDRDSELRARCGTFAEVKNVTGNFDALCGAVGLSCKYVCDFEGHNKPCNQNPNDGSRAAFCGP